MIKILKVTAGSTPEIGQKVDELYASIITAGTHLAPTIKGNRKLSKRYKYSICKLDINTNAVLEAAGTFYHLSQDLYRGRSYS